MSDRRLKLTKKKPTLIAFTAKEWCGPCQMFETQLPKLREFSDIFAIEQVDESTSQQTIYAWGIKGYPTLLLFTPTYEKFYVFSGEKKAEKISVAMQELNKLKPEENLVFVPWNKSTKGLYVMVD
jgi:thiol-disulfide isomerase/thioredoxin